MASTVGSAPTDVRDVDSVSAPVDEIVNKETSPSPAFAAYKNLLEGWITSDSTDGPAVIGLTASCVRIPELGSSRKATIWADGGSAAYKYRLTVGPQLTQRAMLAQTRNKAAAFCSIRNS